MPLLIYFLTWLIYSSYVWIGCALRAQPPAEGNRNHFGPLALPRQRQVRQRGRSSELMETFQSCFPGSRLMAHAAGARLLRAGALARLRRLVLGAALTRFGGGGF